MRLIFALFLLSAAAIAGAWIWLGAAVEMPPAPLTAGEKLYCISYAPFRGGQSPLDLATRVEPWQIEEDLSQLAGLSDCVRTYSVDYGLDLVAEIAARHGLKVIQGLWLSSHADRNRFQIETAIALANRFPGVVRALIVGNEVLLRGEMSPTELARTLRLVKAQVSIPVSYADVWEFWLRHRDVAAAADFITIHILPYWEDFPIPAAAAAAHVGAIRGRMVAAFPDKEVIVGEVGWPSAGRMREGALPSPTNQARVIQDVLALAKRDNFRINLIEAYDQSWKRNQEGTVGGHWGLIDGDSRAFKFAWGAPVSNHPYAVAQAAFGILFAAAVYAVAYAGRRKPQPALSVWLGVAVNAAVGGILIGWSIENAALESLGLGGWLRSLALIAVALAAPLAGSAALTAGAAVPRFDRLLTRDYPDGRLSVACGAVLIALTVLALQVALGLVFDPRYRDFPFAPLSAAAVPFLLHGLLVARAGGRSGAAEIASAGIITLAVAYIAFNEGLANWQSLWLCTALLALAVTLARLRGEQS